MSSPPHETNTADRRHGGREPVDRLAADAASDPGRQMTAATLTILVLSVALATTGQLLLKAGMNEVGVESLGPGDIPFLLRSVFTTWQLLLGLAAFGASAVFWLLALSSVPLSTAYPMVSLSYVFILTFSYLVLGERPSLTVWAGALFVMAGVSLIGIGQR